MSKDPRWLPCVQDFFHAMLISDTTPYNALRHLVLVKLAVNAATKGIALIRQREASEAAATTQALPMDPLSATMAFLRATERVQLGKME